MNDLVIYLKKEFSIKELRDLGYLIGLEAVKKSESITLTQNKYTLELLEKEKCWNQNLVTKGARLSVNDGVKLDNATKYRTIIGCIAISDHY